MATYILLLTLTPEGQVKALADGDYLLDVERNINVHGVQTLGVYGVLGDYDFVALVESVSNEAVGRFSIELGVKAGVHVTTMPAIPLSRLDVHTQALAAEAMAPVQE
jgi:uncharacterized protein with GYD domain